VSGEKAPTTEALVHVAARAYDDAGKPAAKDHNQLDANADSVRVTRLGEQFLDACVRPKKE